jgi:biotin-(acetyl-CoA carboxylase) ligase
MMRAGSERRSTPSTSAFNSISSPSGSVMANRLLEVERPGSRGDDGCMGSPVQTAGRAWLGRPWPGPLGPTVVVVPERTGVDRAVTSQLQVGVRTGERSARARG